MARTQRAPKSLSSESYWRGAGRSCPPIGSSLTASPPANQAVACCDTPAQQLGSLRRAEPTNVELGPQALGVTIAARSCKRCSAFGFEHCRCGPRYASLAQSARSGAWTRKPSDQAPDHAKRSKTT